MYNEYDKRSKERGKLGISGVIKQKGALRAPLFADKMYGFGNAADASAAVAEKKNISTGYQSVVQ